MSFWQFALLLACIALTWFSVVTLLSAMSERQEAIRQFDIMARLNRLPAPLMLGLALTFEEEEELDRSNASLAQWRLTDRECELVLRAALFGGTSRERWKVSTSSTF